MSVWEAIALTLLASACMNFGLVLQKKGLQRNGGEPVLSRAQNGGRTARFHAPPTWYVGLALLIGGYAVYFWAVSARAAPISLLQPLSASGLLVVALMAVVYLDERFDSLEWLGVALLLAGVILLGFSAESAGQQPAGVHALRLAVFLSATVGLALGLVLVLKRPLAPIRAEFLFGILTGLLLGTGYLNTKIVTTAWREGRPGITTLAAVCMAIGLVGGLAVLQMGFRRGRALIVTAVNLVTNQVLVVLGGLVCLGERFPSAPMSFLARILGLLGILAGIVLLARLSAGANGRVRSSADLLAANAPPQPSE